MMASSHSTTKQDKLSDHWLIVFRDKNSSAGFHQSLDYSVPDEVYESFQSKKLEYKQAVRFLPP